MGSLLNNFPFNGILNIFPKDFPKILINSENSKDFGFDFKNKKKFPERLFWQGECDNICLEISKYCGFSDELINKCSKK